MTSQHYFPSTLIIDDRKKHDSDGCPENQRRSGRRGRARAPVHRLFRIRVRKDAVTIEILERAGQSQAVDLPLPQCRREVAELRQYPLRAV